MASKRRQPDGFSLIELLMVIAIMGILVGLAMPDSNPNNHDQLRAAAEILKTDLAYARSLAVTNDSTYRMAFDVDENRFILRHSGASATLDKLPDSPFSTAEDSPKKHVVDLDELPRMGPPVTLVVAATVEAAPRRVVDVEFGPLGETTRSQPTIVWLGCGQDSNRRYLALEINPVTGLTDVGDYTAEGPPSGLESAIGP